VVKLNAEPQEDEPDLEETELQGIEDMIRSTGTPEEEIQSVMDVMRGPNEYEIDEEEVEEEEIEDEFIDWKEGHEHVELEFFAACWREAKKITNSSMRAVIYTHEGFDHSYDLDTGKILKLENYPNYLEKQGETITYFKN
jgi:hypothetical protein